MLQKPSNDALYLVNNVKTTYNVKKCYDLLLDENYDQAKIKLEQVMEDLVLSNDPTGKSTNAILLEIQIQIMTLNYG